ncbi:hypothetical protein HPP92_015828 [Vanilla planifolia]|uniref:Uncharacterized protein n=1 Tax=Vanilla planifolia TaxID=51239 RepID=A0A835QP41_VANPL|nr:hypothetical protein HPP92_027227 [Vanilla planifolia]KAG0471282.1 hypothetical protein HPP92_015828 [Vanilla planifolia]
MAMRPSSTSFLREAQTWLTSWLPNRSKSCSRSRTIFAFSKKNLQELVLIRENLLKKPVSTVNIETVVYEPVVEGTNEEAPTRFAELLSEERRRRNTSAPNVIRDSMCNN